MNKYGFTLAREEQIEELSSTARLWIHDKTGSQLLSFVNKDENKVFGVSFRTPPPDSTGVAHILEHSVLCGSEKYPVKEPFVELLKSSLQTFLNAFTYPDKTCYPVASANLQDFYNLMDVYMDAVFFPRITESIFQQEGWHLEAESVDGPLTYKGVVYNEMKGAFSSPDSVLARQCLHHLFPDTVYALESGGDPEVIPELTYENFVDFHRRYYHPTNGRFWFWGDDPEDARLEKVGAVLERFEKLKVDSTIAMQQPMGEPRRVQVPFAAGGDEKGMAVINWLCSDVMDVESSLAFRMLEHMLLGMPASPLRRALIESGLGEDLAGQGLEDELRQLTFDVGLKGIDVGDVPKMEKLVFETLENLVNDGLPDELVEAAMNTVEFALRENNSGRFPVGLAIMLRSLTTWLHDGDPLAPLRFEGPLADIKERVKEGEKVFEGYITRWLLQNNHRVTVVLAPDTSLAAAREKEEQEVLRKIQGGMGRDEMAQVVENTKRLADWQALADRPEDLALIPRLDASDMPKENIKLATQKTGVETVPLFFYPQPTSGIGYVTVAFDLDCLPEEMLPYVPLLGRCLVEMGTRKKDFLELNMTIARKTGGMDAGALFLTHSRDRAPVARLMVDVKAAPDKLGDMFDLLAEVLTEYSLDRKERFLRMVLEEKARQEQGLIPAGHAVVTARLNSGFSKAGRMAELTGGISYLEFLRDLAIEVEAGWAGVLETLQKVARLVLTRSGCELNVTALPEQEELLQNMASKFAAALPQGEEKTAALRQIVATPDAEALILPAAVNYMGKGLNLFDEGYAWHGSALVILKHLRTGYLWEKVRVQGGAYGCICSLDRMNGTFALASYRDPNVLPTLEVYDALPGYLQKSSLGREELSAAIVGAIGALDAYLLPDAKGSAAFGRYLVNDTEEMRQKMREEVLGTTNRHFKELGEALASFAVKGRIAALGGPALERAAREKGWQVRTVL